MERRRLTYTGRVQGVGFRATAVSIAAGFTVTGWVRNEPDGDVLLEAQGPADELDGFLGALRRRMERMIREVRQDVVPPRHDESGFRITR